MSLETHQPSPLVYSSPVLLCSDKSEHGEELCKVLYEHLLQADPTFIPLDLCGPGHPGWVMGRFTPAEERLLTLQCSFTEGQSLVKQEQVAAWCSRDQGGEASSQRQSRPTGAKLGFPEELRFGLFHVVDLHPRFSLEQKIY